MKLMRRFLVGLMALVAVAALARSAAADDAMWRNFRGRVMFSDIALAPAANFESPAMMTAAGAVNNCAMSQCVGLDVSFVSASFKTWVEVEGVG